MDFATMMTLEPHGPDTYVGIGPKYPWGGLYGGQIVAQALRAAAATVDRAYRVHSLHAYFIRRGDHDEPIRFEVDRIRNGRSFVTTDGRRSPAGRRHLQHVGELPSRRARARYADGADAERAEAGRARPDEVGHDVRAPVRADGWRTAARRSRGCGMNDPIGDDPALHACALAYLSDDLPTDAVVAVQHPDLAGQWGDDFEHTFWTRRSTTPSGSTVRCRLMTGSCRSSPATG